jgi:hypothetical protein
MRIGQFRVASTAIRIAGVAGRKMGGAATLIKHPSTSSDRSLDFCLRRCPSVREAGGAFHRAHPPRNSCEPKEGSVKL